MRRVDPHKLHVTMGSPGRAALGQQPRRYTLTHSDRTGQLYLTMGNELDQAQIAGWHARSMRDEALAEWRSDGGGSSLHVYCHVSGGVSLGTARWRDRIFRHELPLVLEALRYGDRDLFGSQPLLGAAPVWVHFHSANPDFARIEQWGVADDYL